MAAEKVPGVRGLRLTAPAGQLAGTHVAHAELNALAQLPADRHWADSLLLTTLEPCLMCHGAAIQSTVAGFYYAGRDPCGGTAALRAGTPQAARRDFVVGGPLPGQRGGAGRDPAHRLPDEPGRQRPCRGRAACRAA